MEGKYSFRRKTLCCVVGITAAFFGFFCLNGAPSALALVNCPANRRPAGYVHEDLFVPQTPTQKSDFGFSSHALLSGEPSTSYTHLSSCAPVDQVADCRAYPSNSLWSFLAASALLGWSFQRSTLHVLLVATLLHSGTFVLLSRPLAHLLTSSGRVSSHPPSDRSCAPAQPVLPLFSVVFGYRLHDSSDARSVSIALQRPDDRLLLQQADDDHGTTPTATPSPRLVGASQSFDKLPQKADGQTRRTDFGQSSFADSDMRSNMHKKKGITKESDGIADDDSRSSLDGGTKPRSSDQETREYRQSVSRKPSSKLMQPHQLEPNRHLSEGPPLSVVWHANVAEGCGKRVGIVLSNLGSPDAPTYRKLWSYLRQFLSDRRVVDKHPVVWQPILHTFILPFRSSTSAKKYKASWTSYGSPLVALTQYQAESLQEALLRRYGWCSPRAGHRVSAKEDRAAVSATATESDERMVRKPNVVVIFGMRYGKPSVQSALKKLHQDGIGRIAVLPLYPQPAEASVASMYDAVFSEIRSWRFMPDLRIIGGYADHPAYIDAVAKSVEIFWRSYGRGQRLIITYHGLPANQLSKGDPYSCYCSKTTRLLAERLNLKLGQDAEMAYQARFGSGEWLRPYLSDRLEELAGQGVRILDVVSPGFSADCLETIDEIDREFSEMWLTLTNGEGKLRRTRCLNNSEEGTELLVSLADQSLAGWIAPVPS